MKFSYTEVKPPEAPDCPNCFGGKLSYDASLKLWICNYGFAKCQKAFRRVKQS